MRDITLEELLEAGCHFGHQVNRRNPKADEFIFEARSNIHIINLEKTREGLIAAGEFVKDLSSKGGYLLIVSTKRQARGIVKEEIERVLRLRQSTTLKGSNPNGLADPQGKSFDRAQGKPDEVHADMGRGLFYVMSRWIGGTFTNFEEVAKNYKKLKELESFLASDKLKEYTKREVLLFEREKHKLEELYRGIVDLDRIPDAVYIIDTHYEKTAIEEARKMEVTTIGIVDTNADPAVIDYPIPANDDAVGSIKLITTYLIDAWIEGKKKGSKPSSRAQVEGNQESGSGDKKEVKVKKQSKKKASKNKKIEK